MRFASILRQRLNPRSEDGLALVLALAVLVFASASTATAIYMTTSTQTTSNGGAAAQDAYSLAEAGLNDALAVLNGQLNSDGTIKTGATDPRTAALFSTPTTVPYADGSVTYSGTINSSYVWTITSIGKVTQQDSSTPVTRKLTQQMNVLGIDGGASGGSWSRFYQDSTSTCLTIPAQEFITNIGTKGNLCLQKGGYIGTPSGGTPPNVDVGGNITITGVDTTAGPKAPTAATGTTWTNPSNVYTDNAAYATYSIAKSSTSNNLDSTGFGFSIPTGASITGIAVSVDRYATCCNAVQTIAVSGTAPTQGTFVLSTSEGSTAAINYNASASAIQSALTTSSVYGSGNVTCTGGPINTTAVACTFVNDYSNQSISTMTLGSKTNWKPTSGSTIVVTSTTTGSAPVQDSSVYLLKNGAVPGGETNKATTSGWPGEEKTVSYGSTTDLWGTTWMPADVDTTNFGVRLAAKDTSSTTAATAEVDSVTITIHYLSVPNGIGALGANVGQLNVGGSCQLNNNAPHGTCSSADDTYASPITTEAAASNPVLSMPEVDFTYWYANAKPGPDNFCTNPNPGITKAFFDNDTTMNGSVPVNGEMAGEPAGSSSLNEQNWTYDTTTPNIDYDCQVWSQPPTGGTLLGEIGWNHTTHVMTISGTVYIDGSFRFDNDGNVIHYFGRGDLMSTDSDEIDSLVCAGGSGTTPATSCLTNMASWSPSQNMMVLMSDAYKGETNEYDQGGTTCSGNNRPTCYDGHPPAGFQGILYSKGECEIHQEFQDSGPVICETINLPDETYDPTYFTFPSVGDLTDGQTYAGTADANNFEIQAGQESG